MTKFTILILLIIIISTAPIAALASEPGQAESSYDVSESASSAELSYTDFAGKEIAVVTGNLSVDTTKEIGGIPVEYNDNASALEDVKNGRVAGYMYTLTALRVMVSELGRDMYGIALVPTDIFFIEIGALSYDQGIIDDFNNFLRIITEDGTLEEMKSRYFGDDFDINAPMPEVENAGGSGVLKVATCSDSTPYVYMGADENLGGYSIELALRFGAYMGKTVEFADMAFAGLIPYIAGGRADLGIANMGITEERKQSVLFTDPFCDEQYGIIYRKQTAVETEEPGGGFIAWLRTSIERNLITDNRWRLITDGLWVTAQISVLAQILGTVFGCFVCFVLTRKNKLARRIGEFYCALARGMPMVVLLMIIYYIVFGNTDISNVLVAVTAFTLTTGASVAQILKGAIETVDPVEVEAARSLGFSAFKAFTTVTLPQAVRRALPGYTNGFVELVKATAIVGYIAIQDLTRAGDIIRSRTYDVYFPLILVAVIYLIITTICVQLFKFIIKKVNKGGEAV